jgi:hypothetical protein
MPVRAIDSVEKFLNSREGRKNYPNDRLRNIFRKQFMDQYREEAIAETRQKMNESRLYSAGTTIGAATLGLVDTATFGQVPNALDAIGLSDSAAKIQSATEVASETNPVAFTGGQLGGFFTGPAGGAFKLATGVAERAGTRAIPMIGKSAQEITSAGTAAGVRRLGVNEIVADQAGRAAAQIGQNLAGSAAAIGTHRILEARDDDAGLGVRLNEAAQDVISPINLTIAGTAGVVASRLMRPMKQHLSEITPQLERYGFKISPDVAADTRELDLLMSAAAYGPTTSGKVQTWLRRYAYEPMGKWISDIASSRRGALPSTPRGAAAASRLNRQTAVDVGDEFAAVAAEGVRRTVGGRQSGTSPGRLTRRRRAIVNKALEKDGQLRISTESQNGLIIGLRRILRELTPTERKFEQDSQIRDVIKQFFFAAKLAKKQGRNLTIEEINPLYRQLGEMGFMRKALDPGKPAVSEVSVRIARDWAHVMRHVMGNTSSRVNEAYNMAAVLRKYEAATRDVQKKVMDGATDESILNSIFTSGPRTLEAFIRGASPNELQYARGWYMARVFERFADETTNFVNLRRLESSRFAHTSMFNRQVFDRILPGVRQELNQMGKLSRDYAKGIGRAEGSPTAGRQGRFAQMALGRLLPAIIATAWYLNNPYIGGLVLLGGVGTRVFMGSLISGKVGENIVRLASGGRALGPGASAVAAQQVPGADLVNMAGNQMVDLAFQLGFGPGTGAVKSEPAVGNIPDQATRSPEVQ